MPDVISLGVGEPDFDTPSAIVEAGIRSLREGRTHYTSNYGTIELRRALAAHLERRYGVAYDPEREIVITVGVSEALAASLAAVVDPGDEVILAEPTYVAYVPDIVFAGGHPGLRARRDPRTAGSSTRMRWRRPSRPARGRSSWASPTTPPARSSTPSACAPWPPSPSATTSSSSATRSTTGSSTAGTATRPSAPCPACATGPSCWAASRRPTP